MDTQRRHTPDPYLDPDGSTVDIYRLLIGIEDSPKRAIQIGEFLSSIWFLAFCLMLLYLM